MNSNSIGRTVGASVAALALVGLTACGGETPQVPNVPTELPQVPGVGDPRQAFGDAHQKALGLAALGGVGLEQGVGQQVKDLAPQVQAEGQQIDERLRGLASGIGVSLPDQVSPEIQAQVDELKAQSGEQFDQGWLQAAQEQVGQLNDQAQGLLNVPGLPPEQVEQARAQVTNLGELKTKLDEAAVAAGVAAPGGEGAGDAAGGEDGAGGENGAGENGAGGENGAAGGEDGAAGENGAGENGAGGENGAAGSGSGEGSGSGTGGQAAGPDAGAGGAGAEGSGSGQEGTAGSGGGSAETPGQGSAPAVDAGTGGQAASASDAVLPVALGGAGLVLLAAGLIRLRRSRA
ncbi:protein of unknown function [Pseudonocardia ammonioxydans]|uniref:DUF4142 domain-containing protein n=1 Tax=Pseudonocardia ammonioxydans TaxID=260086 RepID=A0A1I4UY94_PSUAM|nr:DUF4142 domain-containing protein [Pseudonocardia ammonioxydans]SFM93896.1 protein of unknown function [Pseudonocardia ammonioxydans]